VSALRKESVRTAVSAVALVAIAVLAVVSIVERPAPFPEFEVSRALEAITAPTVAALDHNARYLVRGVDARTWDASSSGLIAQLDDRGFKVFAEPSQYAELMYGSRRIATPGQIDGVITVVAIPELDAGWQPPPGSRLVASYDPLTPEQRARARELETKIKSDMGAKAPQRVLLDSPFSRGVAIDGGASPADVAEFHQLQPNADGFEVFVSPAPQP
jgi:hypothetical protein